MNPCAKPAYVPQRSDAGRHCPRRTNTPSQGKKQEWLEKYAHRMLGQWLRWQSPLGVACAYAEQIKTDIAEFYEDPLKRMFIEATYGSGSRGGQVSC